MAIVHKPSGKAFPTAIIVRPKYVLLKPVNFPKKVNKSTNNSQQNFVHKTDVKIPINDINIKYLGISSF